MAVVMTAISFDQDERELVIDSTMLGDPVSKARARVTGQGGKTWAYTPSKTKDAEEAWQWQLRAAYPSFTRGDPDYDYRLEVSFYTATWKRRDLDNMLKLVSDACNGMVYADDDQVTQVEAVLVRGDPAPRTELRVYRLPPRRPPKSRPKRALRPTRSVQT